jgi:uncharacterized protein YecE (DUF72 family)
MPKPATPTPLTSEQRRARREERRAKQRLANAGRAAKMHAARLVFQREEKQLNFFSDSSRVSAAPTLPAARATDVKNRHPERTREGPGPERQSHILRESAQHGDSSAEIFSDQLPHSSPPRFNIGCSGWFYWDWKHKFYPPDIPTTQWFGHYAAHFDTVELNAPFYSWPTIATVKSWLRQAPATKPFFYTIKVCELITHVKRFQHTATLVKDFTFIADLLRPHMGCFLFQLPPSFHFTPARLSRIVDQLDPAHRNVLEFRHASWWNAQVYRELKRHKIIFCSISAPRLPNDLIQTHDEIYLRFHGTKRWYRHDYSNDELAIWSQRLRAANFSRAWIYFNNDYGCHSIHNSRQLFSQLSDPQQHG